jgi:hypothetical protein
VNRAQFIATKPHGISSLGLGQIGCLWAQSGPGARRWNGISSLGLGQIGCLWAQSGPGARRWTGTIPVRGGT